jgi:TIR domain/Pentapeptide repeats (8 copies)
MANEEHLAILKKGVGAWNRWRGENPSAVPDLSRTDLKGIDLHGANLDGANLFESVLAEANLTGASLIEAHLALVDLRRANLIGASLIEAHLPGANVSEAILCCDLNGADLTGTECRRANLKGANLVSANLDGADAEGADLRGSWMGYTLLVNIDLSAADGLSEVVHQAPSTIGIDTIYRSKGNIPEVFLRGARVPEPFIVNMKALVAAMAPIEFYSCFISYSSKDEEFARGLYADLQNEHVRCWFAPEDLKIGAETRTGIDEAILLHDKLLIVLSANSVQSAWVKKEVETAFDREQKQNRMVLFPIRLDDAVMETDKAWAADIRRMRNIGDFRKWKNRDEYQKAFARLLSDLKTEEKGRAKGGSQKHA